MIRKNIPGNKRKYIEINVMKVKIEYAWLVVKYANNVYGKHARFL